MTIQSKQTKPNQIQLINIGYVDGTPAGELKVGDRLLWNYGEKTIVSDILKQTKKTITILEGFGTCAYERTFLKSKLVCRY